MQLTRFDRWLRETFVYETHIHTLRPPPSIPAGIRAGKSSDLSNKRYPHSFIAKNSKHADVLIRQLKEDGQMYTTHIANRNAWLIPLIAPKGKSVTWRLFSIVVYGGIGFFVLHCVKSLIDDAEFRKHFTEIIEIMKG